MRLLPTVLDLKSLRDLYAAGAVGPGDVAAAVSARMAQAADRSVFITPTPEADLRNAADALGARAPAPNSLPLWGIPFAVKDNIDVAGLPTTAACPAFAYVPAEDAHCVARLKAAGALVVGKTNLDQFATGLNGTRSPYGAPRSVFDARYISGGSSSGSAVAVAAGLATFALGTDTAGSGRVPAAFNNLVGIKPTPGRISTRGVVPACRSLDCVSIFALAVGDGVAVRRVVEGFDPADPYSNCPPPTVFHRDGLRIGVLAGADRVFFGDARTESLYDAAVARLASGGAQALAFDFAPFAEAASLLYDGPWVAERLAALEEFHSRHADAMDPNVRAILEQAAAFSAVDAFRGRYRLEALRRRTDETWRAVDALLLPTAPTIYTVEAMLADPIRLNSHLGRYTNFANLLGLAAVAVPAGFRDDGLPAGVTLIGPGGSDDALAPLADALHRTGGAGMGLARSAALPPFEAQRPPGGSRLLPIVVVGAHLSGMPLNGQLTELGGALLRRTRTAGDYRLFALPDTRPAKPGLVRVPGSASGGVEVEVWGLDPAAFAHFASAIPAPLCLGQIALDDGSLVPGFLCDHRAAAQGIDITAYGGWRAYRDADSPA